MNKIALAAVAGALAGVVASTQFVAPLVAQEKTPERTTYENLDLFGDVFERIRSVYVEKTEDTKLIEAAINGMLTSLDPHSAYLPPKDFEDMQVQTRGEFGGLGIEVTTQDGFGAIRVVSPIDDTPAKRAGIEAGDIITEIDGVSVLGMPLNEAVDKMRGDVGSEITLTILREKEGQKAETLKFTLTRDKIKIRASRARLEGRALVMRVSQFTDQTTEQLLEGLKTEIEKAGGLDGIDGVVLDLRNNPGGLLNQAVSVADAFLDKGEIVSTRGRDPQQGERYNANPGDMISGKPLIVLVNAGSASASEIVAGALQDHRRAVLIGAKTFGKGSVQTIMQLQGGGALRLTTSRYYTPSGRSIQALGIEPDILVEEKALPAAEDKEPAPPTRSEADLRGRLDSTLSEDEKKQFEEERKRHEATAKLRSEDFQLAYAIDMLRGLSVLGPRQ